VRAGRWHWREVKEMTVSLKIVASSFQVIQQSLSEIASMRAELIKKYPDIVVNVEVEVR